MIIATINFYYVSSLKIYLSCIFEVYSRDEIGENGLSSPRSTYKNSYGQFFVFINPNINEV